MDRIKLIDKLNTAHDLSDEEFYQLIFPLCSAGLKEESSPDNAALKAYAENPSDTVINNFKQFLHNK